MNRRLFLAHSSAMIAVGAGGFRLSSGRRGRADRLHIGAQTVTWGVPIQSFDHLLEILDSLGSLGYQGFETNYLSLEHQASRAVECRRAFEARHIQYVAPHTGGPLYDRSKVAATVEQLRRIAGWSAEMGASHLIASGPKLPHVSGKLDLDAVRAEAEGLNQVGRICHQEGLRFCYHNHYQEFQDEPSEMSFLLRETDPKFVWLNYDVGNPYGFGPDATSFSKEHFRRIGVYHIKDVKRDKSGAIIPADLGTGLIDLKGVVAPLLDSNWEGWLLVEREGSYPHPAEHPAELMRQCREYLRSITGV